MSVNSVRLEELSWSDVEEAIKNGYKTVVIGVGSTEQHGPHLPLAVDAILADHMALRLAEKIGNALVAPTIRTGYSAHHLDFAGTVSLREETLTMVIEDYIDSLVKHGFENIVIVSGHGGNIFAIRTAMNKMRVKYPRKKIIEARLGRYAPKEKFGKIPGTNVTSGEHGGYLTNSQVMVVRPDLVHLEKGTIEWGPWPDDIEEFEKILKEKGMKAFTKTGTLGDGTKGDPNFGREYFETITTEAAKEIQKILELYPRWV